MAKTFRQRLAPLVLVLVSTLLTLLVLEAAFRILRRGQGGGKEEAEILRYTEYDPILGWRKVPGARVVYNRREYKVEVAINGLGLRDRDAATRPRRARRASWPSATRSSRDTRCPCRRPRPSSSSLRSPTRAAARR